VARDRKQKYPKARSAAEAVTRLDAAEEGALHEIVDVVADLATKESEYLIEVTMKEHFTGGSVASAPGCVKGGVVLA
jgi:hypothetical protein